MSDDADLMTDLDEAIEDAIEAALGGHRVANGDLLLRARDEIVALREREYTRAEMQKATQDNYNAGRAEALEEAARVVEAWHARSEAADVALLIRALKDKP